MMEHLLLLLLLVRWAERACDSQPVPPDHSRRSVRWHSTCTHLSGAAAAAERWSVGASDAAVRLIVVFMSSLRSARRGAALSTFTPTVLIFRSYGYVTHARVHSYCRTWDLLSLFLRQFGFTVFDFSTLFLLLSSLKCFKHFTKGKSLFSFWWVSDSGFGD